MRIAFFLLTCLAAFAQTPNFGIDTKLAPQFVRKGVEQRGAIRIEDVSFRAQSGAQIDAYWVLPPGTAKGAAGLFVHWYEQGAPNSNRTQFLDEAVRLAGSGLTSLLVSTPWSVSDWYPKRDVKKDFENSIAEVKDLRGALLLLSQHERVDPARLALVGHDFGAMYGLLAATAGGPTVKAAALQAFTSSFSDWFLYNQRALPAEGRQAVIERLGPLDPLRYMPLLKDTPVLLQFAIGDFFVPRAQADVLAGAVKGPLKVQWYEAEHGLNAQATADREAWLKQVLALKN